MATTSTTAERLDADTIEGRETGTFERIKQLMALARSEWKALTLATVFLLIGSGMGLAYPQAIRVIIDSAVGAREVRAIDQAAMAMGVIFLLQAVATGLRQYIFTVAGERVVTNLRERLYSHVMEQEIGFFDARRTGELTNRLASDTTVLQNAVTLNVSMALRSVASAIGGVLLLLWTSPRLTLLMLLVVPPVTVGAVYYGARIRRFSRQVQDALADANDVAQETISGIRTVRAFHQEQREVARYRRAVERSFALARSRTLVGSLFTAGVSFAGFGAIGGVLWYGGRLVVSGQMSVGDLTSFILYTLIVAFSLATLGGLWGSLMAASGASDRIFALLDRAPRIDNFAGRRLPSVDGHVELHEVRFAYPSRLEHPVLQGVTFEIRPGEVVALVGPSGGGKSTIASLIPRFYDPDAGAVRFDVVDSREREPNWLRAQIGIVSQEPVLLSTTIRENILYGREDADFEEVVAAARAANAHDFIMSFPLGYDTEVGERGVQLSGGQKQRVAIARAILKDPRVLILDEATSALDAESEYLVKEALERLMQGRTTLIIAHRLSTVRDADRVLVIDRGRIVESGSHDELLARDGVYRALVERQFVAA